MIEFRQEFDIAIERVNLGEARVFLDGSLIGRAFLMPHARAPKKWFACRFIGGGFELVEGMHGFVTDTLACFALVELIDQERKAARIVEKLGAS